MESNCSRYSGIGLYGKLCNYPARPLRRTSAFKMVLYMKEFAFCFEIFLGYHCCGRGEYVSGEGSVKFEDEQVDRLVTLIRENGGETDIDELGLKAACPDINAALEDAYFEAVGQATYRYWLIKGFEEGYYDEPEGMMESLEEAGLFHYEPEPALLEEADEEILEEEKEEAFYDWLKSYFASMDEDDQVSFIKTWYGDVVDLDGPGDYDYAVEIPQGVIDLV